jgi:hypothetical protein
MTSSFPGQVNSETEIGICCFSAKTTSLRSNSKDWFAAILCDLLEPITLLKFGLFKKENKKIAICSKN